MQAKARFACLLAIILISPLDNCFPFIEKNPELTQKPYAPEYIPGQIIVKLKEDNKIDDIKELNTRYYVISAEKLFLDLAKLEDEYEGLLQQKENLQVELKGSASNAMAELDEKIAKIQKRLAGQNSCLGEFESRKNRSTAQKPQPDLKNIYLLKTNDKINIQLMARDYAQNPCVEYAEPDYMVRAQLLPNDPYYYSRNSWKQGYDDLWNLKTIQCAQAWDISNGEGVIVALIDSGIDFSHEDIVGNEWKNTLELFRYGVKDAADAKGVIDDTKGWDFVGEDIYHPCQDNQPGDDFGHGTYIAGIIAAACKNAKGIAGIAPQAKLMSVKGLDARGQGCASIIANSFKYATDHGADIINCSFAGLGKSHLICDIAEYADFFGCIVVAAAGNNNDDVLNYFPANTDTAVAVGAITHNNELADFSNWGGKIDLVAPGGDYILSLKAKNKDFCRDKNNIVNMDYYRAYGTSAAAAHVSGAFALILSKYSAFSTEQAKQALRMSAENPVGKHWNYQTGYGRINVYKALWTETPCQAKIDDIASRENSVKTLEVKITAKGEKFSSYVLDYSLGVDSDTFIQITNSLRPAKNEKISFTLPAGSGKCLFRLRVYDTLNNVFEDRRIYEYATVKISWPLPDAAITDKTIEISGNAAGNNFKDYAIECSDLGTLSGNDPVHTEAENGILATLDIGRLRENKTYTLTLKVRTKDLREKITSVNFSVLKNNLPGWPLAVEYAKAAAPQLWVTKPPVIADIDNDTFSEIVVTGYTNFNPGDMVAIYRADGSLHPGWPQYTDRIQLDPENTLAGDINGDNKMEIIAGSETSLDDGVNRIFAWDESGEILARWPIDLAEPIKGITLADLDNNSELEIIVTAFDNSAAVEERKVKIYAFNKDGKDLTGWPVIIPLPEGYADISSPAIAGDCIGDETKEVVIPLSSGKPSLDSRILMFDAKGKEILNRAIPYVRKLYAPVIGDIDNDKDNEIIIGADADTGKIFAFHGNGETVKGWPAQSGETPAYISLADLDRDGYLEVVADTSADWHNSKNSITALDHSGKVKPGWPIANAPGASSKQGAVIADINGDGISEIFSIHQYITNGGLEPGILKLYARNETGLLLGGYPKLLSNDCLISGWGGSPILADLNRDGKTDIAAARADCGYIDAFPAKENGFLTDNHLKLLNTSCFKEGWHNPAILPDLRDGKTDIVDSGSPCGYTYIPPLAIEGDEGILYWPMFKHDPSHTNNYPLENDTEKDLRLILFPGWNFLSAGLQLKNPSPSVIFSGINIKDNLYKFDNSLQLSTLYNGPIKPQDAYWLKIMDNDIHILKCRGRAIREDFAVKIPKAGWASFGSPRGIPWEDCIIKYNDASYTIREAKASGLINSKIKMFDAYRQEIVNIGLPGELTGNTFLRPNKGYWIQTLVDNIELLIPKEYLRRGK